MSIRRSLLLAALVLVAVGTTPFAFGNDAQAGPRETWVTPGRSPLDCGWYRTADPKRWSPKRKAAAEKTCRIVEEWRSFVTAHQDCSSDKDCVLVRSSCPFGCMNVPVGAAHAKALEQLQADLQEKLDDDCKYKCPPVTRTVCENGWCVGSR